MGLNLYRRHWRECKSGHPEDSLTSEFDERKKGFRRCECPIIASGTPQRRFKRKSTDQWQWDDAKAIAAQWEESGNWDARTAASASKPTPAKHKPSRPDAPQAEMPELRI
ncbi:MAG: hypothetical protein JO033_27255 [Acidobacteriaceae bacterium]|nr:hypothetical protein [Acidobacteriaceae bacterium]MBV9501409.1 hypothetical protein [Acidobacteriaceae bacterium]